MQLFQIYYLFPKDSFRLLILGELSIDLLAINYDQS